MIIFKYYQVRERINTGVLPLFLYFKQWFLYKNEVYAVCSQNEIDKLISFEGDYVSFNKEVKKIKGLKRHKAMKFDIYNISYKEDVYRTFIEFKIIKDAEGAANVQNIMIAEDDLYYAKENLDHYDVLF